MHTHTLTNTHSHTHPTPSLTHRHTQTRCRVTVFITNFNCKSFSACSALYKFRQFPLDIQKRLWAVWVRLSDVCACLCVYGCVGVWVCGSLLSSFVHWVSSFPLFHESISMAFGKYNFQFHARRLLCKWAWQGSAAHSHAPSDSITRRDAGTDGHTHWQTDVRIWAVCFMRAIKICIKRHRQ